MRGRLSDLVRCVVVMAEAFGSAEAVVVVTTAVGLLDGLEVMADGETTGLEVLGRSVIIFPTGEAEDASTSATTATRVQRRYRVY
jgi:hypothetical protein